MTVPVFVDTNVLVYERDTTEPDKQRRASAWIRHLWETRSGHLSFQVLQELYVTVTHKLDPGLPAGEARQIVRDLTSWETVEVDLAVLEGAWRVHDRFSLSWWDALIVSAARISECRALLTEDLQHGQRFGDLTVVDPFVDLDTAPADILSALD